MRASPGLFFLFLETCYILYIVFVLYSCQSQGTNLIFYSKCAAICQYISKMKPWIISCFCAFLDKRVKKVSCYSNREGKKCCTKEIDLDVGGETLYSVLKYYLILYLMTNSRNFLWVKTISSPPNFRFWYRYTNFFEIFRNFQDIQKNSRYLGAKQVIL